MTACRSHSSSPAPRRRARRRGGPHAGSGRAAGSRRPWWPRHAGCPPSSGRSGRRFMNGRPPARQHLDGRVGALERATLAAQRGRGRAGRTGTASPIRTGRHRRLSSRRSRHSATQVVRWSPRRGADSGPRRVPPARRRDRVSPSRTRRRGRAWTATLFHPQRAETSKTPSGFDAAAIRRPTGRDAKIVATASRQLGRAGGRTPGIRDSAAWVQAVPIENPLASTSQHVVESPRIGLLPANLIRTILSIIPAPCDCVFWRKLNAEIGGS